MKRLIPTLLVLLGVGLLVLPGRAAPAKKNVVLIVSDDHGLDLGCYGNPAVKTPHLDALAAQGTRFTHAFCTTPSCSPSRSVILSGLHTHANGQYGLQHATHKQAAHPWVQGLPNLLKQAGYRTCSIGKTHVAPKESFDFEEYANDGLMGRNTVRMAENAERWIRKADDRPFFLYFCPNDPHRAAQGFANNRPYPGVTETTYAPKDVAVPHFLPDQPEVRAELAEYYQAVSRVDTGVGRLMRALKDTGHLDDTLILYLSDNGIPFPGAKTSMYEPGVRLPLLVRSPDQARRGSVSDALVDWSDLVPTVLEYTGAKGPDYPLHGRSFLPAAEGRPAPGRPGRDEVYGSHQFHEITMYYPVRMVRNRRYKYLLNLAHPLTFPFASDLYESKTWQGVLKRGDRMYGSRTVEALLHRPRHELYDLEADPRELQNLAEKPEHAAMLKELQGKLRAWQERTKDPWLVKYEYE